jgi:hypothetical protein
MLSDRKSSRTIGDATPEPPSRVFGEQPVDNARLLACRWIGLDWIRLEQPVYHLIAEFYLVDRGLRHRLPGFSSMGRLVILP